jgi:hypothetical protein
LSNLFVENEKLFVLSFQIQIFNQRSWRYVTVMILSYLQALGGILYFMGAYHQNWKFITVANESSKFWSLFVFPNCTETSLLLT